MTEGNKDWREELMQKYDSMFADRKLPMTQTCMCWGLEVGDGWQRLLTNLCEQLEILHQATGIRVKFLQVKEKYSLLRCYYSTDISAVDPTRYNDEDCERICDMVAAVVSAAEHESGQVCEECGGVWLDERVDGWNKTLCAKHAFEQERELSDFEILGLSPEDKATYKKRMEERETFFKKLQEERKDRYDEKEIAPNA